MDYSASENLVLTLSASCLRDMGMLLSISVGKNYKDLAASLGFSQVDVSQFELQDPSNPGLILLKTWSFQTGSTVTVLRETLNNLNRADVIQLLEEELQDPVQLVVIVKDSTDNKILFDGSIQTYGSKTVRDTLNTNDATKNLLANIGPASSLETKAAEYKGKQESNRRGSIDGTTACQQKSGCQMEHYHLQDTAYEDISDTSSFSYEGHSTHSMHHNLTGLDNKSTWVENDYTETVPKERAELQNRNRDTEQTVPKTALTEQNPDIHVYSKLAIPGFHPEIRSREQIWHIMQPYLRTNGAFIVRPSRGSEDDRAISVIEDQKISNYRIHRRFVSGNTWIYFLYPEGPYFDSLPELLSHYQCNSLNENGGSMLHKPI